MKDIHQILQRYWGYTQFRPMQEAIIQSILKDKDTLALLPTGGGKSLCFQVPAMASDGLCLVISPLIALMKDQVEGLRKKGITAFSITSELKRNEVKQILITAGESNCKFLYVSPERLQTSLFQEYLFSLGISMIAVDEAHCISQWGYDFRPSYLKIASLRESLPEIPIIAVTASATPEVQQDICTQLQLESPYIFRGSFLRPALSFRCIDTAAKTAKIIEILKANEVCSIVYCRSRNKTQELASLLNMQEIKADYYHAGLSSEERIKKQEAWMDNVTPVMVCTNAFGMGIDKPDVRIVIHYDMPDCIENYYQEAGRAGRDGQKAYALLLHNENDSRIIQELSAIRYPSIDFIRDVYQAIVNYMQIPAGMEMEDWMDFDFEIFTERFALPKQATLYAMQQLEQEGWIIYAPKLFIAASAEFIVNKNELEDFESAYPVYEPLIKTLLRTYGGILDMQVGISEYTLSKMLNVPKENIIGGLKELHRRRILFYQQQDEKPRIRLPESRPLSDEWLVQPKAFLERKKKFEERSSSMIAYASTKTICRSVFMAKYFGDTEAEVCGICDQCIVEKKKKSIDFSSFHAIVQLLELNLKEDSIELKDFLNHHTGEEKERIMEVIRHLMEEGKILITEGGRLQFNK
jgi:ATP-dependent DNA helicase RecQ